MAQHYIATMKKDTRVTLGLTTFVLREGDRVEIRQIDKAGRKVLIESGTNIGWVPDNIINLQVRVCD